jgi:hypothetical protein
MGHFKENQPTTTYSLFNPVSIPGKKSVYQLKQFSMNRLVGNIFLNQCVQEGAG